MQPVWCIEVGKKPSNIKWFLVAPEYGELTLFFDTEIFPLFYKKALKNLVLSLKINKATPFPDVFFFIIESGTNIFSTQITSKLKNLKHKNGNQRPLSGNYFL